MSRENTLKNLVEFSKPIVELSNDLSNLTWDYEGEPFTVYAYQILEVLNRYISADLSSEEIENWANLIECREDIEFEKAEQTILENIIYQLANPTLEGEITPDMGKEIISRITKNKSREGIEMPSDNNTPVKNN